jgi:hypothetical protein
VAEQGEHCRSRLDWGMRSRARGSATSFGQVGHATTVASSCQAGHERDRDVRGELRAARRARGRRRRGTASRARASTRYSMAGTSGRRLVAVVPGEGELLPGGGALPAAVLDNGAAAEEGAAGRPWRTTEQLVERDLGYSLLG